MAPYGGNLVNKKYLIFKLQPYPEKAKEKTKTEGFSLIKVYRIDLQCADSS